MGWLQAIFGTPSCGGAHEKGGGTAAPAPRSFTHMQASTVTPIGQVKAAGNFPRTTTEIITPQAARHMRDTAHFERQRAISPGNVTRLAAEMTAGRFTPGTQVYVCVLPDGTERIINGNHTLEAVAASGVSQVLSVTRHPVSDEDEAGRIYAVFDIQKARSWADSLKAAGTGTDIPRVGNLLGAIGAIDAGFGHRAPGQTSRLGRIDRIEEYREAMGMWLASTHGGTGNTVQMLKRAGVLAVALETFRHQPSMAEAFWSAAARDDGLAANRPEKALLNWLRNARRSGGSSGIRDHARAAALAWNASYRGETRTFVKPNQMGAFFLLGTPYASGLRD
jgi:hypothetical protein